MPEHEPSPEIKRDEVDIKRLAGRVEAALEALDDFGRGIHSLAPRDERDFEQERNSRTDIHRLDTELWRLVAEALEDRQELVGPLFASLAEAERPEVREAVACRIMMLYSADPEGNREVIAEYLTDDDDRVRDDAAAWIVDGFDKRSGGPPTDEYLASLPLELTYHDNGTLREAKALGAGSDGYRGLDSRPNPDWAPHPAVGDEHLPEVELDPPTG